MKILVTGNHRTLGRLLVKELEKRGHEELTQVYNYLVNNKIQERFKHRK